VHYLASVSYIMKMCHDLTGQHQDYVEWVPPYSDSPNADMLMEDFEKDLPSVIGLGIYLWNQVALHEFARRVKEKYPDTVVVLGGPDIEWKTAEEYTRLHPYYDYLVYGDGEEAFPRLLDALIEEKTSSVHLMTIPNLIFRDKKGELVRTKHEVYRGQMFTENSHWLYNRDDVIRDINEIKKKGIVPVAAWDSDRGCPYKCTFCDWSAGLHQKVTKKKYDTRDDIQFFAEQGIMMSFMNANFGIYDSDAEVMDFIWETMASKKYPGFVAVTPSWAKVNKDKVHRIYEMQAKHFDYILAKPSLQSISEEVLKNIERPSVPWPEHKEMLLSLRDRPNPVPVHFYADLMVGLPGETRASWDHMMLEFIDMYPVDDFYFAPWHILPNSPGFDKEYQKKLGMKVIKTAQPHDETHFTVYGYNEERMLEMLCTNEIYNDNEPIGYQYDMNWGSYSHDIEDQMYMIIATGVIFQLQRKARGDTAKKAYNAIRSKMWDKAQREGEKMRRGLDKYGVMPFYNWHDNRMWQYRESWFNDQMIRGFKHKMSEKPLGDGIIDVITNINVLLK